MGFRWSRRIDLVGPHEPPPRLPVAGVVRKPRPDLAAPAGCCPLAAGPRHTVAAPRSAAGRSDFASSARIGFAQRW
ncbi:hypothetical protein ACN27G_32125 [Plantactinospora sp. WMMB334]|uniref:hypothetical protein n=1 Tax=Plantactinospora sp. WMMB334 TaxID=3404119 RepID=UPI003B9531FC